MKRTRTTKLAATGAAALLALGAAACEVEEGTDGDTTLEDPLEDTGDDL